MAMSSARYVRSCGGAALVSHLCTKSCYCRSASAAVRPRSQSCMPMQILSPTSSASHRVSDFERWLSTAGPGTGHSKSSLKDWMQYLSRFSPNIDVSSMTRVLTSLHVDLPRNLPEIKQLFPNISFAQFKIDRFRHDKVSGSSNPQSYLSSEQLNDADSMDDTKQSPSTEKKKTVVRDSAQLHYTEQPVSDTVITSPDKSAERKISVASMQQHSVQDSITSTADKSHIVATTSTTTTTDSVVSKFNTVASGIARQIAEYMPTVDINSAAQTKPPTHVQQKQENRKVDTKHKTKANEVKEETPTVQMQTPVQRQLVTRGSIDRQTRGLVLCLRDARTSTSQLVRLEELSQHIAQYSDCTGIAVKVCH